MNYERELERWKVPALEVVAVKDGDVVVANGYGPGITPHTLFHHGSTGKAFTAFLCASLVDDGLLEWDRQVREYLPEFRLADPYASDHVTVRDLLAHRTGLPRHEWAWLANPSWPRAEVVRRMQHLPLSAGLRERWQYSNIAYTAAGHLAGVVSGSTWEDEVRGRVFEPLGMVRTTTRIPDGGDRALPHGQHGEIVYRHLDSVAPAGQILSCATDTARWLLRHTSDADGAWRETHVLQMSTGTMLDNAELPHVRFYGYGLGWLVGAYRGRAFLWHNGGIDGFRTEMAIVPDARAGVAVCGNLDNTQLPFWVLHHVLDELLGLEPHAWTDEAFAKTHQQQPPSEPTERDATKPSHTLDAYAGTYEHPGYGALTVTADGEELRVRLGELETGTSYRHYETWDVAYAPLHESWPLTFVTGPEGTIDAAVVPLEPSVEPIRFARQPV